MLELSDKDFEVVLLNTLKKLNYKTHLSGKFEAVQCRNSGNSGNN